MADAVCFVVCRLWPCDGADGTLVCGETRPFVWRRAPLCVAQRPRVTRRIVTCANLAKNNNEYYELTEGSGYNYYVNVNVIGQKNNLERESEEYYTNFIENNSTIRIAEEGQKEETKIKCFKCTNIKISDITSRVYEIDFEYENK